MGKGLKALSVLPPSSESGELEVAIKVPGGDSAWLDPGCGHGWGGAVRRKFAG